MSKRTHELHAGSGGIIKIGRTGENRFRTVLIDISGWADSDADFRIIYSRPDGITYPLPISRKGDTLSFSPSAYDLEVPGFGKLEIRAYAGETIGKSVTFKVRIDESIQTDESTPSTARPDWVNDILDKVVIKSIEQTVSSASDGGTNVITMTLTDGSTSDFYVKNGSRGNPGDKGDKGDKGEDGKNGEDGYTPIRGIDYWTEEDKAEIVKSVDAFTKEETMIEIQVYVGNELDVLYRIIDPHIADKENPHNVTAEQVGAYTKAETREAAYNTFVASQDYQDLLGDVRILQEDMGDMDTALDSVIASQESILAMQNALIGGDE